MTSHFVQLCSLPQQLVLTAWPGNRVKMYHDTASWWWTVSVYRALCHSNWSWRHGQETGSNCTMIQPVDDGLSLYTVLSSTAAQSNCSGSFGTFHTMRKVVICSWLLPGQEGRKTFFKWTNQKLFPLFQLLLCLLLAWWETRWGKQQTTTTTKTTKIQKKQIISDQQKSWLERGNRYNDSKKHETLLSKVSFSWSFWVLGRKRVLRLMLSSFNVLSKRSCFLCRVGRSVDSSSDKPENKMCTETKPHVSLPVLGL